MKKLVNCEYLDHFRLMMYTCNNRRELIAYFDEYILEIKKQEKNDLKRVVYNLMKSYKEMDEEKYNQYYILYQNLKSSLSYEDALKIYKSILENSN